MPKYKCNRNTGWPFDPYAVPRYAFDEEFDSDSPADAQAVEQGYLLLVGSPLKISDEERSQFANLDPSATTATPIIPFNKKK